MVAKDNQLMAHCSSPFWAQSSEESLRALAQHCVTLADVAEDVAAALDHKNPKGEADDEPGQRLHGVATIGAHHIGGTP